MKRDSAVTEHLLCVCFNILIGHTRYSTFGGSDISNIQPFVVETLHGLIAVAHNGELVNSGSIKQKVPFLSEIRIEFL